MKKLLVAFSLALALAVTTNSAQAQITPTDVLAAAANLVNVQIGSVNVNAVDVVDVDIANVLNRNDVDILVEILKNVKIDNVLTNVLRDADIITGNQVVIGVVVNVLGGVDQILVADKRALKK